MLPKQLRAPGGLYKDNNICQEFPNFIKTLTMKHFTLLLLSGLIASNAFSQEITWSEPIEVATYELADIVELSIPPRPRIAVTQSGAVNIIWAALSGFDADCAFVRMDPAAGENAFSEPEILNIGGQIEALNNYGPNIAAKDEQVFVVYKKSGFGNQVVQSRRSVDGGMSWEDEVQVDEFLNGTFASRAHVAIDAEGDPHVSVVRNVATAKDIGGLSSVNGGVSYTAFVDAYGDVAGTIASPPFIAIDGNTQVVLWTQLDVSEVYKVYAALSTDGGESFEAPVDISGLENYGAWINLEEPEAVLDGNTLHAVWPSIEDADVIRYANCTIDEGITTNYVEIVNTIGVYFNPTIAMGGEKLCAIWEKSFGGSPSLNWAVGTNELGAASGIPLFDDELTRNAPHLTYQDGFHLTYVNPDSLKIMYMYGELETITNVTEGEDEEVKLYPVPAREYLLMEAPGFAQAGYLIVNTAGQNMTQGVYQPGSPIDIRGLAPGVYFLLLESGEGIVQKEFVVR